MQHTSFTWNCCPCTQVPPLTHKAMGKMSHYIPHKAGETLHCWNCPSLQDASQILHRRLPRYIYLRRSGVDRSLAYASNSLTQTKAENNPSQAVQRKPAVEHMANTAISIQVDRAPEKLISHHFPSSELQHIYTFSLESSGNKKKHPVFICCIPLLS